MSDTTDNSSRAGSIVRTLCNAEGDDVVFRFGEPISTPVEKYDGRSYKSETVPKATLNATIQRADVEDLEGVLTCHAAVPVEELDRVGIEPPVVYTEPIDGPPKNCIVDVHASREWIGKASEISMEEAKQAVEEGRQEEVLPPWDGLPTVVVRVERTEGCLRRSYNSNFHVQFDPPRHEMGKLIDVRIK
jgi:hypothetical protein